MRSGDLEPRVRAVLGPTNTGKTFLAIERMLGHASGMIGFPLRLLARENYDRVVRARGLRAAALVTGEERIVPPTARYFLCTVESMPLEREVEFLAVDEIQLAADAERGHVFTDRLLNARGRAETMFLGAETVRGPIARLVPGAEFERRPRFSTLAYTGPKKVTRLPPRSAVVAFTAQDVYALAELIRRQRGGAAIVMGALSPRTRNAQVALYQAGEVDHLVATDAIGMGLNMDVEHVAFAGLAKFDGRAERALTPAEIGQIAGRAGRYMNDGTFGTTAELGALDAAVVEAVEGHRFDPVTAVFWRRSALDFSSLAALARSLARPPERPGLMRAREADDAVALAALARDPAIRALAANPAAVRLLWEVCRIPDFRKLMSETHARLLARVYRFLMGPEGRLPADWVNGQVGRLDRTDGDIDTLMGRIAHIRVWTYVAQRADWIAEAGHWQERTRAIEDRLSDALHERLTQRFVDRRAAALVRRMRAGPPLASVGRAGEVAVEGERIGRLEGFLFRPDETERPADARLLAGAAERALRGEVRQRVVRLEGAPDPAFALSPEGAVSWEGQALARLGRGPSALRPRVEVGARTLLEGGERERVRARLEAWLAAHLRRRLRPLYRALEAELPGPARGLVFQLSEWLGTMPRETVAPLVGGLDPAGFEALARLGVRVGRASVFMPALNRPEAVALRALLFAVHRGLPAVPPLPPAGRGSAPAPEGLPPGFAEAVGWRRLGGRLMRAEQVERLATEVHRLSRQGPFAATRRLAALVGGRAEDLEAVLGALGFRPLPGRGPATFAGRAGATAGKGAKAGGAKGRAARAKARRRRLADSPFARLLDLATGK
ncbi:MAG: disulfide oxidoreductase [Proteobacteria bacterium]|nr:disulfide oxidoreductase [Pseudomonadota bacterium]